VGFSGDEVAAIMGGNWERFFAASFGTAGRGAVERAAE